MSTKKIKKGAKIGEIIVPQSIIDYSFAVVQQDDEFETVIPRHRQYRRSNISAGLRTRIEIGSWMKALKARDSYMADNLSSWSEEEALQRFQKPLNIENEEWNITMKKIAYLENTSEDFTPNDGIVASSNWLLKNPEILQNLHLGDNRIIAAEMETAGFVAACDQHKAEWLVIRAISDYGDPYKCDAFQDYASANAATYLNSLLNDSNNAQVICAIQAAQDVYLPRMRDNYSSRVRSVLEAFCTVFKEHLNISVNLEIYWRTRDGKGVCRDGTMRAERSGGLNRCNPCSFFPFTNNRNERIVAKCVNPSNSSSMKCFIGRIPLTENTPLKWVAALAILDGQEKIAAICCTGRSNLFEDTDSSSNKLSKENSIFSTLGLVRDIVSKDLISAYRDELFPT